ncbi:MAG: hypothetical protein WA609_19930, partial [Terriglobales bacterium]
LFDVLIRFVALVQVADCMRGSAESQTDALVNIREFRKLSRFALGDWVSLFRSLRQFKTESPFLVELTGLDVDEKILDDFVKLRNDTRGHGTTQGDAYYKTIFEQHIGKMEELLRAFGFLRNYWLLRPISITHGGAYCDFSAWKLTGANPSFNKQNVRARSPLSVDRVVYLNRNLEALELDPYMVVETCEQCGREEFLLFDKFSGEKITYLGYDTCPKPHRSSYPYAHKLPRLLLEANRRA